MLSLLQSTAFVHAFLLVLLLAWLAGSIAMVVSDAHDAQLRQTGQPARESAPPALSPADAGLTDTTVLR